MDGMGGLHVVVYPLRFLRIFTMFVVGMLRDALGVGFVFRGRVV